MPISSIYLKRELLAVLYISFPLMTSRNVIFFAVIATIGGIIIISFIYIQDRKKHFKNEQRSKDAAAKKRHNTSGVGKINNYYEDIYIPPYNNTD